MNSDTILDYAQFQLSPRRTRCELFVSGGGKTEKLASGFLKPFLIHLKVAEEQANQAVRSIKLEVEKQKNAGTWFNKGTLERFVRFVSTPQVLELVNTYDAEMSQLEGARKIYSQGAGDQLSGENESATAAAADITKKELLGAMDVRLTALKQDLATACARASAVGFTLDTVSELLLFADQFGALHLNEACTKFISLCQRQPELVRLQRSPPLLVRSQWKGFDDANVRSSSSTDMSIDEPEAEAAIPFRQSISGTSGTGPETLTPTSAQLIKISAAEIQPSVRPLMEKDTSKNKVDPSPSVAPSDEPVQPPAAGSRRLSVQDRINLFESKQKEQSGSASISSSASSGGGINKVVAGKGEHRRLPSDASVEKSVLRRWSGASDMSIDLTNNSFCSDRKESGSAAGTPTSSAHSQVQSESKIEEGAGLLKDKATSWPKLGHNDNSSTMYTSSSLSSSQTQTRSFPKDRDGVDDVQLKEVTTTTYKTHSGPSMEKAHGGFQTQFGTSTGGAHQGGFSDETNTLSSSKPASESGDGAKLKDHTAYLTHFNEVIMQNIGMKDQAASQIPSRAVPVTLLRAEPMDQAGADTDIEKSQAPSTTKFRTFAGKTEDGADKPKDQLDSQFQSKAFSGKESITPQSDLPSRSQWKTYSGNQEAGRKEEATASHLSFKVSSEDSSGSQRLLLHGRTSAHDQMKKLQERRDERLASQGTNIPVFSVKKAKERDQVLQLPSTPPLEHSQVARPLKGNSELNDELLMKADELEKLFAAHKLRAHGDQTASSRRSKTIEGQVLKSAEKRPVEVPADQFSEGNLPSEVLSNGAEFDTNLLLKMVDNLDSANSMKQKLGSISPSDDSRGKLYERYAQKRDAKLREEWGSKRAQKEAKMKAMHDSLERSQEEMKAKLAGSSDKRDSVLARRRAEKMRSFNLRSAINNQGQIVDPLPGEGEDLQELDQVLYGQDRSYSDTLSGNESSTSPKRLVSSKSLSSSTPRISTAPIPKPSAQATNSGSVRRRAQPKNPLAQSVPSFSDLRKENTKPVTGVSKVTSRTQPRTFARSKSATEEANPVKEEKSRRSHSMRKSLAIPGELKDIAPLSSDGVNLTSLKFPKEQMKQCINKIQKSGELKPFLRKGNGIGPGTGAGLSKLTASANCEANDEDSEGLMDQREDSPDMVKDYEEEFDKTSIEGNLQTPDFPVESDGDNGDHGSENGDVLSSLSQDVDGSIAVSAKFNSSAGNVLESPGESPGSWNSNIYHTFSYAREASDIDASVDSLTGSLASWNSHPLNQLMEADVARMRKKWGSAQIPVVANAPHQPRKDVTKGFKRLLKFGRKSKGADYLVNDWVSASTASEGDDDTEDGRELGSRTSDELRKSRMGHTVAAYDGFNDGDNFPEQVESLRSSIPNAPANFKLREDHFSGSSIKAPRSFFSLSSFRSKGSEAKPR